MVLNDHQLSGFPRIEFSSTFWPSHESTNEMVLKSINQGSHYSSKIANNSYGDYFEQNINSYDGDSSYLISALSYQNYLCDSHTTLITKNMSSLGFCERDIKDT